MDSPTSTPSSQTPKQLVTVTQVASTSSSPPPVGSQPVAVVTIDQSEYRKYKGKLGGILSELITQTSAIDQKTGNKMKDAARVRGWKDKAGNLLTEGMFFKDKSKLFQFCQMLFQDLGVPMPESGALWSDPKIGQVEARKHLAGTGTTAKVLADTPLGKAAAKMKTAPQGARRGETIDDFAERNKLALTFWGAVSAAYTSCLKGDVHVWLPKGITVGSIFWNDELPILWQRKHDGDVNEIYFHLQHPGSGMWGRALSFDDIAIVDAYATDSDGVNRGAANLAEDDAVKSKMGKNFQVELERPIRVGPLRQGLEAAHQRAQRRAQVINSPRVRDGLMRWLERAREKNRAAKE